MRVVLSHRVCGLLLAPSQEMNLALQESTLWGAVVWKALSHGPFRKLESTPCMVTKHPAGTTLGHGG